MVVIELSGVQFIMVIELSGVQFVLKSYAWLQNWTSAQREFDLKSQVWFQTKIAQHEVQLPLYYIHFEIAQKQNLVSSNILLIQYWAGLKLNSSIFWEKIIRNWKEKLQNLPHDTPCLPAIWSVTLNKPWSLIGCFVFSVASSLTGKKMRFKAKNGAMISAVYLRDSSLGKDKVDKWEFCKLKITTIFVFVIMTQRNFFHLKS